MKLTARGYWLRRTSALVFLAAGISATVYSAGNIYEDRQRVTDLNYKTPEFSVPKQTADAGDSEGLSIFTAPQDCPDRPDNFFKTQSQLRAEYAGLADSPRPSEAPQTPLGGGVPVGPKNPGGLTGVVPQSPTNGRMTEMDARDLLQAAAIQVRQTELNAQNDSKALSEPYVSMNLSTMAEAMDRSQAEIQNQVEVLDQARSGLDQSEVLRFRNTLLNAYDKASSARQIVAEAQQEESRAPLMPFRTLMSTQKPEQASEPSGTDAVASNPPAAQDVWSMPLASIPNPLSRSAIGASTATGKKAELGELFGARQPLAKATTEDALVNRQIFYSGLPLTTREKITERLTLLERPTLVLANGEKKSVPLLHNGYILGGGDSAVDCSSFVSSLLPTGIRKTSYTTLDFRAMYQLLRTGSLPVPPKYRKMREQLIRKVAQSFEAISLYERDPISDALEKPRPGDLLVFRMDGVSFGHVFLVQEYVARRKQAVVIEAAQSAGTVRVRNFDLSLYPHDQKVRPIRPGLMILRLKQLKTPACNAERRSL